jgi:phosphopantetheinyl transferase (holo-ACP synthase)
MKTDVLKDCQEITVKAVSFPHLRGTVLYASFPSDAETVTAYRANGPADKNRMISVLWEHLAGMEGSCWKDFCFSSGADLPIQVVHDALGRPQLILGEFEGPAISFSEGGGKIWAVLCGDESDIGIDAAGADEFPKEYPVHRVFNAQEIQHALIPADGDSQRALALLWSIKEAAVKALGCAFHLVDPRQVHVNSSAAGEDGWHTFTAYLSGKAQERFPMAGRCIWVRSRALGQMWLSVAMLEKRPNSQSTMRNGLVHQGTAV